VPRRTAKPGLSERERAFVEAYMGPAAGNATGAAKAAGYSPKTAASIASRLLRKVNIQQALVERVANDPRVASRAERQHFWTAVMHGTARYAIEARLRASELLGKSQGDFIAKHEHAGPKGGPIPVSHVGRVAFYLPDNFRGARS